MGIFGWSYPAGAADDPFAPYNDTCGEDDFEDQESTSALSPVQKRRITTIRNRLDKATKAARDKPVPTFAEVWEGVAEFMPKSGKLEGEEAGDWTPYWCDDCYTWHKTAYTLDYDKSGTVMEGKSGPCIEARTVDQDGNWDFDSATFDGDPDWVWFYRAYLTSDDHFAAWCRYHLWSAENGGADPLEEWFSGPREGENHIDRNIDAALRKLQYLEGRGFMRRRKARA